QPRQLRRGSDLRKLERPLLRERHRREDRLRVGSRASDDGRARRRAARRRGGPPAQRPRTARDRIERYGLPDRTLRPASPPVGRQLVWPEPDYGMSVIGRIDEIGRAPERPTWLWVTHAPGWPCSVRFKGKRIASA